MKSNKSLWQWLMNTEGGAWTFTSIFIGTFAASGLILASFPFTPLTVAIAAPLGIISIFSRILGTVAAHRADKHQRLLEGKQNESEGDLDSDKNPQYDKRGLKNDMRAKSETFVNWRNMGGVGSSLQSLSANSFLKSRGGHEAKSVKENPREEAREHVSEVIENRQPNTAPTM